MTQSEAGPLRIGWACRDITPPRPCLLHGQFYARVSDGAADPITVTALALDSPGGGAESQAIVMSCDLVGVWADVHKQVREAVRLRLPDFDPQRLFLSATHTHTGPTLVDGWYPPQPPPVMTSQECVELFVARAAEASEEAWRKRSPGGVSWAYGHAVVGHNRRIVYRDGTARMYGRTGDEQFECVEGGADHGLDLLYTWDQAGKLTGIVVNLACPSQVSEHEMKVSADFWHETRQELRARLGQGLFVLAQCAPAGDQSPHLLLCKNLEGWMWQRRGLSHRQEIARRIAGAVEDAMPPARADIRREAVLRHCVEVLNLPVRRVTPRERDEALADIAGLEGDPQAEPQARFALLHRSRQVVERFARQEVEPFLPVELHVLRVGDAAFATNPFECFLDFGLRIKARSPAPQTFCVQLAAGYEGYLPTARAVRGGHYGAEVASNEVGPEGGQMLVNRTLDRLRELWT